MARVDTEAAAATSNLRTAHETADEPWTVDQFLAAAQVRALLAVAYAVDKLADTNGGA